MALYEVLEIMYICVQSDDGCKGQGRADDGRPNKQRRDS